MVIFLELLFPIANIGSLHLLELTLCLVNIQKLILIKRLFSQQFVVQILDGDSRFPAHSAVGRRRHLALCQCLMRRVSRSLNW